MVNHTEWYLLENKVTKLTAQEPIIYGGSFQSIITDCTIIKEGEAIGTFFGYRWAGIDNEGYDTFILPMMK